MPVRIYLVTAIASLVSSVVIVLALIGKWPVIVIVLALIVGLVGFAVLVSALVAMVKVQVVITVTDDGYRIVGTGHDREGRWRDVTRVSETTDGRHITIYHDDRPDVHLLMFPGARPQLVRAMLDDMARRLDAAYGYGAGGPATSA